MVDPKPPWSVRLRLHEVQRAAPDMRLEADAAQRAAIARQLDLVELRRFAADVQVRPWLDGAEVSARWEADIVQTCGVSLDAFDTPLSGRFVVRAVPEDSPAATSAESEVTLDLDAEDPPDVLESDMLDLGAYLVEHLALEIDPFPRKPGVEFEPRPEEKPASPFVILQQLRRGPDDDS
jgi:hypothetical protein